MILPAITQVRMVVPKPDVAAVILEARDRGLEYVVNTDPYHMIYDEVVVHGGDTIGEFVAWFEAAKSTLEEMRSGNPA